MDEVRDETRSRKAGRRTPVALDQTRLEELALRYVSRFATTRAKLVTYLRRKIRERGWSGQGEPPISQLAARFVDLGYVDDAAFARAKAGSLSSRGYGVRRVQQALMVAGVSEADGEEARSLAESSAVEAALRFARRRRYGPFAERPLDRPALEKALAAMIRAGHSFGLARVIVETEPGQEVDAERLQREIP